MSPPAAETRAEPIRILLVDDHKMLRQGLRSVLDAAPAIAVVGEAGTGVEALEQTRRLTPDVVLMDVGLPDMNGIETTRALREELPGVRVLALSTHSDRRYVASMLEAGASGYVVKAAAADELLRAIEAVAAGQRFLSPEITGIALGLDGGPPASPCAVLGPRERQVLKLLAEGLTTAAIAERLSISPKTVETHRRNIAQKLGVKGIAELTKFAIREGLTTLEP